MRHASLALLILAFAAPSAQAEVKGSTKALPPGGPATARAAIPSAPPQDLEAEGGIVKLGENVNVPAGKRLTGSVVVLGASAAIAGHVEKDLIVLGGTAEILGTIGGDVVVLGPRVRLGPEARVKGDFVTLGASVGREETSRVLGDTFNLHGFGLGVLASAASALGLWTAFGLAVRLLSTAGWLLLAMLAGAAAPKALASCATSLNERPLLSLLSGALFWPAVGSVGVAMLLSLIGIPFLPVWGAAAALLAVWGYLAAGGWLGGLLLQPGAAAWLPCFLGVGALQIMGWIPVLGKAVCLAAHLLGVGATLALWLPRRSRN